MAEISKTADHALSVLEKVSESGLITTAELSRSLKLNRTIVHRLVTTLHLRGFIVRRDNGYAPGALLLRLAARVEPELRAATAAVMRDLSEETGETLVLHIADGSDALVIEQVVGAQHLVRVEHKIGSRHSLRVGASGRALLAFMDERSMNAVINADGDPGVAMRTLAGVRELGYAISHDELQQGVYGLAVPIRGHGDTVVASLAILIPTSRASEIATHIPLLTEGAARIRRSLAG